MAENREEMVKHVIDSVQRTRVHKTKADYGLIQFRPDTAKSDTEIF
jgi:hypothetical protein